MSDTSVQLQELLSGSGRMTDGCNLDTWDAEIQVAMAFPQKPYCLVRQWIIIEVDLEYSYKASLADDGLSNHVLFAREVVLHSRGKRDPGDWIRSTFQRSLSQKYIFESVNTAYVLMGRGVVKKASPQAVMAIGCRDTDFLNIVSRPGRR